MTMESSVRQAMRAAKNAVMQFSEIEVKIREATSNDPWGPSTTLLAELARATNNYEDYPKLFHRLWQRLNDTEHVMHVQKSLIVVDYLLRNGAERFINDCKRRARDIAQLKKYKHYDTNNQDDAKECRARAKLVYDLLMDDTKIAEERGKASRIRDVRLQGFGSGVSDFNDGPTRNVNEGVSNSPGIKGGEEDDDERPKPQKKEAKIDGGKNADADADDDGEKKKKKKKKKEAKEENGEVNGEPEGEADGEKKKKKKKKKKAEGEPDAPRKPSFGEAPFPSAVSSSDPFANAAADPFAAPSAASAYAAVVASAPPTDDIFSKLAGPDISLSHVKSNGEIDFVTGGGNGASNGEDLSNLFSSSLSIGGESNKPSPHRSQNSSEPAMQVFGQKQNNLWESDLLNIDNIKDENKKKSIEPKEQQMTMGMMRSIQPLGSTPTKQDNSHRKSGIVPPAANFGAPLPTMAPMGGMGMGYGVAPVMAPIGMTPMGMAPMVPMGGMAMGGMGMGGMGMAPMGMVGMGGMNGGMNGMGMGGGMGRSAPGPNSVKNDIFFK